LIHINYEGSAESGASQSQSARIAMMNQFAGSPKICVEKARRRKRSVSEEIIVVIEKRE
jgi:hypothetical protein